MRRKFFFFQTNQLQPSSYNCIHIIREQISWKLTGRKVTGSSSAAYSIPMLVAMKVPSL